MTYDARERTVGHTLLTQEQKIIPIRVVPKDNVKECCCKNQHEPYLLNGILVTSLSPGCKIHAKSVLKWLGSEPIGFDSREDG